MIPQIPRMVQMGDGRMVPASTNFGAQPVNEHQKFLIVLQYYNGDVNDVEELANIICDLERVRNHDADIMLFGRHDAMPFPSHTRSKLESKFDKVHAVTCRNRDSATYPFSANCMFYDLITLLGQYPQWNQPYFAFINLESDCVPVHPGWIRELITEFKIAQVRGKHAIGHINHSHSTPHMNGVGVYAIDMFFKVPGGKLAGGMPNVAYDLYQAPNILPLAYDTPLIAMEYRRPTITAEDLFKAHKGGTEPALYHGVKDASAREAVKAKHITFSSNADLSRQTVFTYFDSDQDVGHGESNELLDLWKNGWQSRGWNPVVLRLMDASRNPRFSAVNDAVTRFPYAGDKRRQRAGFLSKLALDTVGGGFMVNIDQQPNSFTPAKLKEEMAVRRPWLKKFFDATVDYVPKETDKLGDRFHVSDETIGEFKATAMEHIMIADVGGENFKSADVVDFSDRALADSKYRGHRKADVIREYLRGAL